MLTAADLTEGERYYIVPTTAGGLYRYMIHDLVRCVGFEGNTPMVEFLSKGAHFSSLTGEKLSEYQVVLAVNHAQQQLGMKLGAYLVLPHWSELPHYHLVIEETDVADDAAATRLAAAVEQQLQVVEPRIRKQAIHPPTRPNPLDPRTGRVMARISAAAVGEEWRHGRTI